MQNTDEELEGRSHRCRAHSTPILVAAVQLPSCLTLRKPEAPTHRDDSSGSHATSPASTVAPCTMSRPEHIAPPELVSSRATQPKALLAVREKPPD